MKVVLHVVKHPLFSGLGQRCVIVVKSVTGLALQVKSVTGLVLQVSAPGKRAAVYGQ